MKAITQETYGSEDVLELRDIDDPVVGDKDVLIRVRAAGAGPDVWHLMTGQPYMARPAIGLRRPKVPVRGWDVAGTVQAVGAGVTAFRPGDEVMGVAEGGSFASPRSPDRTSSSPSPGGSRSSRPRRFRSPASRPSRRFATRRMFGSARRC